MLTRQYGLNLISIPRPGRIVTSLCQLANRERASYSSVSSEPRDVAVLGGGITGLACAYYLSQSIPSARITIYEAGSRIGGWLSSKRVDVDDGSVLFEAGPRTLRPNGNGVLAKRLIHDLGLADETIFTYNTAPAATNRFLYYPDHLVRLPAPRLGLFNLVRTILTEPAFQGLVWNIPLEAVQSPRDKNVKDESIASFFSRRIGARAVDRLFSAVIHGIYAGDVYKLSVKSLFPSLWRDELEQGSILEGVVRNTVEGREVTSREAAFALAMKKLPHLATDFNSQFSLANVFTFRNGLTQFVDAIVEKLRGRPNVKFVTSSKVERISLGENRNLDLAIKGSEDGQASTTATHTHVISSLAPAHLGQAAHDQTLSAIFNKIPTVTVMTVNLYYRTPGLHPPGFGYLIPLATSLDQNPERALGVVFDTSYSATPGSEEPEGIDGPLQDTVSSRGTKLTVMLGGHYWDGWPVFPSKDEGLQMAQSILQRHLGITEKPAAHAVNLQQDCIPQYTVGHEERLRSAHNRLLQEYKGRLRVAGNWVNGVGVNDCLRSAWDVVRELRDDSKTGLEAVVADKEYIRIKPKRKGK